MNNLEDTDLIRKSYGTIIVLDYSKNNNLIKFKCKLLKPIHTVVAWGIYNCNTNKTFIRIIRHGLDRYKSNISKNTYMRIIEKILSQQDWNENIAYYASQPSKIYNTVTYKRFMQMWDTLTN